MAFNFNWSPLIADTDRVREMLTSSLNKGSKPPIIVDDIIVNELNLGSTPPDLEILEIGDLAEDKFRGIFKMSYTGDAYLTLKTRVQANPLKTYLSAKTNTFASPMPLAAGSGLVIPLQITLSDIRLSGFVILVFSKQKGITLVFRNDPIESLKVSSTFDSIPFVRDYLQKTIESQLRVLFMEDLPAIIHRLSLKMFNPEYQDNATPEPSAGTSDTRRPIDPFATPSQQAIDASGLGLDDFSLDTPTETYASFSQKNLLRLAALSESQRTLSLFTPGIRDTVYRAWTSATDRNTLASGTATPANRATTLSRIQSTLGSPGGMSSAASQTSDSASQATRPSLASMQSLSTVYSFNTGRPRQRKRKHRVVNLRKHSKDDTHEISDTVSVSSGYTGSASQSASQSASGSAGLSMTQTDPTSRSDSYYYRDGEISTPPQSPEKRRGSRKAESVEGGATIKKRQTLVHRPSLQDIDATPRASMYLPKEESLLEQDLPRMKDIPNIRPGQEMPRTASELSLLGLGAGSSRSPDSQFTGGILSQAWMRKGAMEVARKVEAERARRAQYGAAGK